MIYYQESKAGDREYGIIRIETGNWKLETGNWKFGTWN